MAIGYVDVQDLAVGTGVAGFSTASFWPSNTWGVAASGAYKYAKKVLSVSFDMLRYVAQGTSAAAPRETTLRLWLPSPVTGGTIFGVAYSGSANGWGMDVVASTIQFSRLASGGYAPIGSAVTYASPAPPAGTRLIARLRWEPGATEAQGTLRGKLWLEGDAEPGWMLEQTRADWPVGAGNWAPGIETFSTNTVEWDFWGWATNGDTAPLPGQDHARTASSFGLIATTAAGRVWAKVFQRSAASATQAVAGAASRVSLLARLATSRTAAAIAAAATSWGRAWSPCPGEASTEWDGCGGSAGGLSPPAHPAPSSRWEVRDDA